MVYFPGLSTVLDRTTRPSVTGTPCAAAGRSTQNSRSAAPRAAPRNACRALILISFMLALPARLSRRRSRGPDSRAKWRPHRKSLKTGEIYPKAGPVFGTGAGFPRVPVPVVGRHPPWPRTRARLRSLGARPEQVGRARTLATPRRGSLPTHGFTKEASVIVW